MINTKDLHKEILRKSLHLSSVWVPLCYNFLTKESMLILVGAVLLVVFTADLLKLYNVKFGAVFNKLFAKIMRQSEANTITSASHMLVAIFLTILIFPKIIAILAITILVISDSAAALLGKLYGKRKFFNKTIIGSLAFFVSGLVVIWLVCKLFNLSSDYYLKALCALIAATFVEFIAQKMPIDDNFSIPLTFASVLYLMDGI